MLIIALTMMVYIAHVLFGLKAGTARARRISADGQSALRNLRFRRRQTEKAHQNPASHSCVSLTWWLWRSGCTRSHSELGRETPQRRWYFVSRRGRVGRCQVCQDVMEKILSRSPPSGSLNGLSIFLLFVLRPGNAGPLRMGPVTW